MGKGLDAALIMSEGSLPMWLTYPNTELFILPVEVSLCKRASRLYGGHLQCLHGALKMHVGINGSEAAEVVNSNQHGGSLTHGSHIQLSDEAESYVLFFNK